jgi:hypothetical protein
VVGDEVVPAALAMSRRADLHRRPR